jgi:DNA mismatch repair ATPase MutS
MEYIQKLFLDKELIAKSVAMSQIKCESVVPVTMPSASIGSFYTLKTDNACLVGPDVMTDIEIVDARDSESVFQSLDGCSLNGSRSFLKDVLLNPCCDKHLLKRRQTAVMGLEQDNIIGKAESLISAMSTHEADM